MSEKKILQSKNALVSFSQAIESVVDKVSQSVVSVHSRITGNGSGVLWNTAGHIITCSHIVKKLEEVEVSLSNGMSYPGKVIGNDPYSDIALLKIEANDSSDEIFALKPIEIVDSENLKAGQFVLAVANPYGKYPSITEGIITSERSSIVGGGGGSWAGVMDNIVITDTRLNPGYSGGPLINVEGKMIGLNAAYISSRGIAIRASKVKNIADRLRKDGVIKGAYLGIAAITISLPAEVSEQLERVQEEGLMVLSVEKDTPAKKAGLLMGDIIARFDSEPVTNMYELRKQLLKQDVVGKSVDLAIMRGEKMMQLTITPR